MGHAYSSYLSDPETRPNYKNEPTFDPLFGFNEGRKERVMQATQEEMESAGLPLNKRDYCAHLAITHRGCRADVWPLTYKCKHDKHAYLQCQHDDYVMRMKEYEREKRLLERAKRMGRKAAKQEEEE